MWSKGLAVCSLIKSALWRGKVCCIESRTARERTADVGIIPAAF